MSNFCLLSLTVIFLILLPFGTGKPNYLDRGCGHEGVFCKDIDESSRDRTIKANITIQQKSIKIHRWIIWLNTSLPQYSLSINLMNEMSASGNQEIIAALNERKHFEIRVKKKLVPIVELNVLPSGRTSHLTYTELPSYVSMPDADRYGLTLSTNANVSQEVHFHDKIKLIIRMEEIGNPRSVIIREHVWQNLFLGKLYKDPKDITSTIPTTKDPDDDYDDEFSISTPKPSGSDHTWIWILVGLVGLIAVTILCILIFCTLKYAYVVRQSSRRTSTSFLSSETTSTSSVIAGSRKGSNQ